MNTALDSILARADGALNTMHEASEGLSRLRVTLSSPDEIVTVTVDATGALIDLQLASDLTRTSAAQLESAIVAAASDAAREALARRASILQRMQSSLSDT
ncbi:MAG: YbaB/EbfC family nucleoid-associated protein [Rhodococcus sp. (in: high G+C Gram-positive bacteria)]